MHRSASAVAFALALILGFSPSIDAQQDPFEEGPVINLSHIRTEPGQFDAYMSYIFGDYARLMEAQKEAGLILDWGVYVTQTRTPDEANVMLTTVYPNMAAFDGLAERARPIVQRVMGATPAQSEQAFAQRGQMRTVLGSQLLRRLEPRP
jgi:hypothetical protein